MGEKKTSKNYRCSSCNVDIDKKVYTYSKKQFNKVLCRNCQKLPIIEDKPELKKNSPNLNKNGGMKKRESNYREGMIKGRIAETLIEELFLTLKFNVFRYGMENTVPGIIKLLGEVKTEVADNIRRMPDFVIQHPENKNVYFIEVKFRAKEKFNINDKSLINYPFKNAYFIIVSKKHIKCITYKELEEGNEIKENSMKFLLGDRKEFELDKKVIIEFCKFAVKFFENV